MPKRKKPRDDNKIMIIGVPPDTDQTDISELCEPFGKVYGARVVESRGFAFVTFSTPQSCEAAIKGLHKTKMGDRTLNVRPVEERDKVQNKNKASGKDANKILIAGIPVDWDDDKLEALCDEFGVVREAKVVRNAQGKSKCFGFVGFTNKSAQEAAILMLNKREMPGDRVLNVRAVEARQQDGEKGAAPEKSPGDVAKKAKAEAPKKGAAQTTVGSEEAAAKKAKREGGTEDWKSRMPEGVCIKFQIGRCHRGKSCRWRHEKVSEEIIACIPRIGKHQKDAKADLRPDAQEGATSGPGEAGPGAEENKDGDEKEEEEEEFQVTDYTASMDMSQWQDSDEEDDQGAETAQSHKRGPSQNGTNYASESESDDAFAENKGGVGGVSMASRGAHSQESRGERSEGGSDDVSLALASEATNSMAILGSLFAAKPEPEVSKGRNATKRQSAGKQAAGKRSMAGKSSSMGSEPPLSRGQGKEKEQEEVADHVSQALASEASSSMELLGSLFSDDDEEEEKKPPEANGHRDRKPKPTSKGQGAAKRLPTAKSMEESNVAPIRKKAGQKRPQQQDEQKDLPEGAKRQKSAPGARAPVPKAAASASAAASAGGFDGFLVGRFMG